MKPASHFDLSGQVAVVTGGTQGIGLALSEGLVSAGAVVAVVDLPEHHQAALALCQRLEAGGWRVGPLPLDVCHTATIAGVFEAIQGDFGRLDILVNNAGTPYSGAALEVTEHDWDRTHNLNLKAMFFCAQAAARLMLAQGGGNTINLCCTQAMAALPDGAPDSASKGGVASLTRALAREWMGLGIRVNAIAPGRVDTLPTPGGHLDAGLQQVDPSHRPQGRQLLPEELVGAALLLASPAGKAMVGHLLVVDGGQMIH